MAGTAGARAWANLNNLRRGLGAGKAPEARPVRSDSPGIPSFPAQVRARWSWQWPDGAVISCGYLVLRTRRQRHLYAELAATQFLASTDIPHGLI